MTNKQKCEKLAKILETVVSKLRDPNIGQKIWERDESRMHSLTAQIHLFLKTAKEVVEEEGANPLKKQSKIQDDDDFILNDWPDIIL